MSRIALIEAIFDLKKEFDRRKALTEDCINQAKALIERQRYDEAEQKLKALIQLDQKCVGAWHQLSRLYYATGLYENALNSALRALEEDTLKAIYHYQFRLILRCISDTKQAIQMYQQSMGFCPNNQLKSHPLSGSSQAEDLHLMETTYREAVSAEANYKAFLQLGNILLVQNKVPLAIEAYEEARRRQPHDSTVLNNLGTAYQIVDDPARASLYFGRDLFYQERYQQAASQFQKYLAIHNGKAGIYIALSDCYTSLNEPQRAASVCRDGLKLHPRSARLYDKLTEVLHGSGKTREAIYMANEALKVLPEDLFFKRRSLLTLPIIYDDEEEIAFYRERFSQNLDQLINDLRLETPQNKKSALEMLGAFTNFYLPYQGDNDLELQVKYGALARRIMAANYPEWSTPRLMPILPEGGKIRVGYASAYFSHHSVGNMYLGNFRYADKRDFEVYCYYIGDRSDYMTAQFRHYSDNYRHLANDLEKVCEQIVADRLHVLVFPDIGMHPQITQMAALRIAPVQCNSWGNPVTSGIPTVDYYLSGHLMEPQGAEAHYSEQLIRLPNIGIAYSTSQIPGKRKGREAFGIRSDAVAYLSCQSLFKYSPRHDYVFPEIAQRVPDAQFVFLSHPNVELTAKFRRRLKRSFARYNLDNDRFCVFVPRLGYLDYMNLHSVSDIYLDTLGWSGANTTLETVACGLPVVTLPGEFMRGRHSYAVLKMLGIEDTIAGNESDYIQIAVELALRPDLRKELARRTVDHHHQLYEDKTCVLALEEFYRQTVLAR